jgi:hypothetical protein
MLVLADADVPAVVFGTWHERGDLLEHLAAAADEVSGQDHGSLGDDATGLARTVRCPDLGLPAGEDERPGDRLGRVLVGTVGVLPPGPGSIQRGSRGNLAQKLIIFGIAGRQFRARRPADRIREEDVHAVIGLHDVHLLASAATPTSFAEFLGKIALSTPRTVCGMIGCRRDIVPGSSASGVVPTLAA